MAGISSAFWTVVIITDDQKLHKIYTLSPDTKLSHVMRTWRDDLKLFGNWSFVSINAETEYEIEGTTLEMVGEVYPTAAAVTLRAKLSKDVGVSKIFVYLGDECHHLLVTHNQRLRDVLWCLAKRPLSFEHDGRSLDPNSTIKQSGLRNGAVIYESRCQIQVKLSTGVTRTIEMAADSLVCQLIERVSFHESEDEFSLIHRGRQLELDDRVKDLKQLVYVDRAKFVVSFKYRQVSFQTKSQSVSFSDFLSKLSTKSQVDKQKLEEMKFYCTGCQRCICKAANEDYTQVLPINCCETKSLTLVTKSEYETNTQSEEEVRMKSIQRLYADIMNIKATEVSRVACKTLKQRATDKCIDYNAIAKLSNDLRRMIGDFQKKTKTPRDKKKKLQGDLKASDDTKIAKTIELEARQSKNIDLEVDIKTLLEHQQNSMKRIQEELSANDETLKTRSAELETNMKKCQGELEFNMRNNLKDLETKLTNLMESIIGVELFVQYFTDEFSPVVSRPELQSQGQCSGTRHFIRCKVMGLYPGWATFKSVKCLLRPFFTGSTIQTIVQYRGSVDGRDFAEVTSPDDEEEKTNSFYFCSIDGRESRKAEVMYALQEVTKGGRILIPGGCRRTVLKIRW